MREPVQSDPIVEPFVPPPVPILEEEPETVFEEPAEIVKPPSPEPAPVFAPVPEPAPVKKQMSVMKPDSHKPESPVEKVEKMNDLSKKSKEVDSLVNPFQRAADPDNDFNETHGVYRYPDKSTYNGQYLNGKRQGFGTEVSIYGDKYEGQWDRDQKEGFGRFVLFNGDFYEGYIKNNEYTGQGMFIDYESKVVSEGEFKEGLLNGKGTEEYPDGNIYKGMFTDGSKNGQGTFEFKDGSKYTGEFKMDMKHGKGKYFLLTRNWS